MLEIIYATQARGGPSQPNMNTDDGYPAGPTNAGKFRILRCGRHRSRERYRDYSGVKWGTPLRKHKGVLQVKIKGRWEKLSKHSGLSERDIIDAYYELYGKKEFPDKWLFNDFGHKTCYYFKDINHNRRLDKGNGEKLHGEFIHPTPEDEAKSAQGKAIVLTESHGCVHIKPQSIDYMIKKGYLKKGNIFQVHNYSEKAPPGARKYLKQHRAGKRPFQVHFYPKDKIILVKARLKK